MGCGASAKKEDKETKKKDEEDKKKQEEEARQKEAAKKEAEAAQAKAEAEAKKAEAEAKHKAEDEAKQKREADDMRAREEEVEEQEEKKKAKAEAEVPPPLGIRPNLMEEEERDVDQKSALPPCLAVRTTPWKADEDEGGDRTLKATQETTVGEQEPKAATTSNKEWDLGFKINNLEYQALSQRPKLLADFETATKEALATEAGPDVVADSVQLDLSPGSVMVQAAITPPEGMTREILRSKLAGSNTLMGTLLSKVNSVDGITEAATGPLSVSDIRELHSNVKEATSAFEETGAKETTPAFEEMIVKETIPAFEETTPAFEETSVKAIAPETEELKARDNTMKQLAAKVEGTFRKQCSDSDLAQLKRDATKKGMPFKDVRSKSADELSQWLGNCTSGDSGLVLLAFDEDGEAVGYATDELGDERDAVITALNGDWMGEILEFASKELSCDRDVVLAAVKQGKGAAKPRHKEMPTFILVAVAKDQSVLEFATQELQVERKVVLTVVAQNGDPLQWAYNELKEDREIVLAAVADTGSPLQWTNPELQGEVCIAAVVQNSETLHWAADNFWGTEEEQPELEEIMPVVPVMA